MKIQNVNGYLLSRSGRKVRLGDAQTKASIQVELKNVPHAKQVLEAAAELALDEHRRSLRQLLQAAIERAFPWPVSQG